MKPARVRSLSQAYHQLAGRLHETLLCLYTFDTLPKQEDSLQKAEAVLLLYESLINPVLWQYFSDEELKQMASAFTIKQSPFLHRKMAVTETSAFTIAV